jgi:DNA-binding response OmpR family regulator
LKWDERPPAGHAPGGIAFVLYTRRYPATEVLPALIRHGFTTTERAFDEDAFALMEQLRPELVVLAIDPSRAQQMRLLKDLVERTDALLILLVPDAEDEGVATALEAGVDLFIRDAHVGTLFDAQVSSIMRRRIANPVEDEDEDKLTVGRLTVDLGTHRMATNGKAVTLPPMEFRVLSFLARNAGRVVTPMEILQAAHHQPPNDREAAQTVKVYIRRLRIKLQSVGMSRDVLINVRGFGYMLDRGAADEETPAPPRRLAAG